MDGWMDGWVGGWMDGRARLKIAYSNQKISLSEFKTLFQIQSDQKQVFKRSRLIIF